MIRPVMAARLRCAASLSCAASLLLVQGAHGSVLFRRESREGRAIADLPAGIEDLEAALLGVSAESSKEALMDPDFPVFPALPHEADETLAELPLHKTPHDAKVIYLNSQDEPSGALLRNREIPGCPFKCVVRSDKHFFKSADAVIWEGRRMENGILQTLPAQKRKGQRWVFNFFFEAPYYSGEKVAPQVVQASRGRMDYMMTFKGSSDIFFPWFWIVPKGTDSMPQPHVTTGHDWLQGKTKLIVGIISNCIGPRLDFWQELTDLLPASSVQLYGQCGSEPPCEERLTNVDCWQAEFPKYKFYFAAENSRCDGYITEKFVRGYDHYLVPIVVGGLGRRDYERIAPGTSFIHVDDFPSMEKLAEHMLEVDRNETLYRSYFAWREHYQVGKVEAKRASYCRLCQQLHAGSHPPLKPFQHKSVDKFFYDNATCIPWRAYWSQVPPTIHSQPLCEPGRPCQ